MRKQVSRKGYASSTFRGLLYGLAVSAVITLASVLLIAKLIDMEILPWTNIGLSLTITILLASFLGAITSCVKIKRQRLAICAISGLQFWALLILVTALLFHGQYESIGVTMLLIMAGCILAFLITVPRQSHKSRRKLKTYTR